MKTDEVKIILEKYNISLAQIPKIKLSDPGVPEGCNVGDVLKIERKEGEIVSIYYRVIV